MFSKPNSNTPQPAQPGPTPAPQSSAPTAPAPTLAHAEPPRQAAPRGKGGGSVIGADLVIEGDVSGAGEIQIEGTVKGDVRIEQVTVGDGGRVEGGIYAESVEVRGKVAGSITAKQVRLYGACHVDGDITHEQLAMETGAFFQGRSLRLQRPATVHQPAAAAPKPEPRETPAPTNAAKPPSSPQAQA